MSKKSTKKSLPQENAQSIESLQAEVTSLQQELNNLKSSGQSGFKNFLRKFSVFILVFLSVVLLFSLNIAYFVKQNVINTNTFVATTSPIIKDEAVQKVIANQISSEIFDNVNVEQRLAENLPENIRFLAPTLANQIENTTRSQIGNLLNSNQVATLWTNALTSSHSSIINFIENPNNNGVITLNEIYGFIGQRATDTRVAFVFNRQLPDKFGQIELREVKWLPEARAYINTVKTAPQLLSLAFIISLAGAILLSRQKLKTALVIMLLLLATTLFSLWLISFGSSEVTSLVKPENKDAVLSIYKIVTAGLTSQTTALAWLFGAISVGILLNMNIQPIVSLKKLLRAGLDKLILIIIPKFSSPKWLEQIESNKTVITLASTFVWFIALALRLPPTKNGVVAAIWSSVVTILIIEILSSVSKNSKNR